MYTMENFEWLYDYLVRKHILSGSCFDPQATLHVHSQTTRHVRLLQLTSTPACKPVRRGLVTDIPVELDDEGICVRSSRGRDIRSQLLYETDDEVGQLHQREALTKTL